MKKVIIMVSILFVCAIGVLGYYFLDAKKSAEQDVYELNERQVDIVDNKALGDVKINDVVISNIRIVDNKEVRFTITATKTNLIEKNINLIIYNDFTKNPGVSLDAKLTDILKKDTNEAVFDISESYNNPARLEFNIS